MTAADYQSLVIPSPGTDTLIASEKFTRSIPLMGNPVDLYEVRLQVGNQIFTAILDSGSSNLIVPGTDCVGCGPILTSYKPGTRAKDLHIYEFMKYGVPGHYVGAYGDFFVDVVVVSGIDRVSLVVMSVTASGLQGPKSSVRNGEPMRGILGVAPENIGFLTLNGVGRLGNDSYLNALGKLFDMASIVAVQLCTNNGHMWLQAVGYPNPKQFEADPEYASIYEHPYGVGMSVSLGSQDSLNISNAVTLIDTGSSALVLSQRWFMEFMSIIDPEMDSFDSDGCLRAKSRRSEGSPPCPARPRCRPLSLPRARPRSSPARCPPRAAPAPASTSAASPPPSQRP